MYTPHTNSHALQALADISAFEVFPLKAPLRLALLDDPEEQSVASHRQDDRDHDDHDTDDGDHETQILQPVGGKDPTQSDQPKPDHGRDQAKEGDDLDESGQADAQLQCEFFHEKPPSRPKTITCQSRTFSSESS